MSNAIRIKETGDYAELIPLFRESGLEIHVDEDQKPKGMITCWKAERNGQLAGGVSIEKKEGYFVIGDIAVEASMRDENIGSLLLATAMEKIYELEGEEIFLVAKAPKFFERYGFTYLTAEEAPAIFNCSTCDQRGTSCNPEFMTFVFEED